MTGEEDGETHGRGLLGPYGVLIVPPSDSTEQWFVGLADWDEEDELYLGEADGPFLDSREQALAEAGKLLDWLAQQPPGTDVARLWREMQQSVGAETVLEREWPPSRGPWGDWNRR